MRSNARILQPQPIIVVVSQSNELLGQFEKLRNIRIETDERKPPPLADQAERSEDGLP